jgi:transposase
MQKISVKPISEEEKESLEEIKNRGIKMQERRRAHAVLLNFSGKDKKEIATIFTVSERVVYNWIHEWNNLGIASLEHKKGSGRKALLNPESHQDIILKILQENPHQPKKAYALTLKEIGIKVSYDTYKRFLKRYCI